MQRSYQAVRSFQNDMTDRCARRGQPAYGIELMADQAVVAVAAAGTA
jgi:hypothetical protein